MPRLVASCCVKNALIQESLYDWIFILVCQWTLLAFCLCKVTSLAIQWLKQGVMLFKLGPFVLILAGDLRFCQFCQVYNLFHNRQPVAASSSSSLGGGDSSHQPKAKYRLALQGHTCCNKSFRLLIGIGKNRFGRLKRAAFSGEECPVDGRHIPKRRERLVRDSTRPQIIEFLEKCWHQLAEPMPEAIESQVELLGPVKRRGRRPRHLFKKEDHKQGFAAGMKMLPPGHIVDYWELCCADFPDVKISRKLFCQAPWLFIAVFNGMFRNARTMPK